MSYIGTIIAESLFDTSILGKINILSTKVEPVTEKHQTPWLKQWTLHKVEIPEGQAREVAQKLSLFLDYSNKSAWYADFKNEKNHYIIFKDKIFLIGRQDRQGFEEAKAYGMSVGIPEHQVDFPKNM